MSSLSTSTSPTPASNVARVAVLLVIAIVAASTAWLGIRGDDDSTNRNGAGTTRESVRSSTGGSTGSASQRLAPENAVAAPAEGVSLPTGSRHADGYPVGFPYTDLGAVALQVELAKTQVGFDYDQAATVARLYSDSADQAVFEQRSRDAVALRRAQAGVPAAGEVPAPASYALTPLAYTLTELDTDFYAVNLLSHVTLTSANSEAHNGLYAGTQLVRWVPEADADAEADADDGGDWKVAAGSPTDLENLVAQRQPKAAAPQTKEFEAEGWIMISLAGGSPHGVGESP